MSGQGQDWYRLPKDAMPKLKLKLVDQTFSVTSLPVGINRPYPAVSAGLFFKGKNVKDRFFTYKCPCGVEVSYPLNGIPEVTTPHPCGVDGHYSVLFEE